MKIGFTGTRKGLTLDARNSLIVVLTVLRAIDSAYIKIHHGDCVGADEMVHRIAVESDVTVIIHPPLLSRYKAGCKADEYRTPRPYLERNHDIVDETDILIACPETPFEETRSGTWATVRYARKMKKIILMIYPDGDVETEEK